MHQFSEYLHQNWSTDHKIAPTHYNQAAEKAITTKSHFINFFGTPCRCQDLKIIINQLCHDDDNDDTNNYDKGNGDGGNYPVDF